MVFFVVAAGSAQLRSRYRLCLKIASAILIFAGGSVLAGWFFDITVLKSIHPAWVAMKANTAIAFVLIGVFLALFSGRDGGKVSVWAKFCAGTVFIIGFLTLWEYLFGWNLLIDQLFFEEPAGALHTASPGRMAFTTAFNFTILGLAMVLLSLEKAKKVWHVQGLALVSMLVSFIALIGYLYEAFQLEGIFGHTRMAVHTTVLFIASSLGLFLACRDRGFMAVMISENSGGVLARRLILCTLFLPIVLDALRLVGQRAGFYTPMFGSALFALSVVVISTVLVVMISYLLQKIDVGRMGAEARFRVIVESSFNAVMMVSPEGRIQLMNQPAETLFRYEKNELMGAMIEVLIPARFRNDHPALVQHFFAHPQTRPMGAGRDLFGIRKDGVEIPIEIGLHPISTSEGPFVIATIVDVTVRKELEKKLAEELAVYERMNKAMTERETRMMELKNQVNDLLRSQGKEVIYNVPGR